MKNKITILITDSGLGGISVLSELEKLLASNNIAENVSLIYANAYPGNGYGYNSMKSVEEKVKVFNCFLKDVNRHFEPDLILIACNTLSVIYDRTEFHDKKIKPVFGIVDVGVKKILNEFDKNALVLLTGTETTINSEAHKKALIQNGIPETSIISQSCKNLESQIQKNADSVETIELIEKYLSEALSEIEVDDAKIVCGLFCTHYGFSENIFRSELKKYSSKTEVVNPNKDFAAEIINKFRSDGIKEQKIEIAIYSRSPIDENDIISITNLIEKDSAKTSEALKNYSLKKDLFIF